MGIYKGTHVETGHKVAVKLEKANTRHPQLQYESRIYKHMKGSIGVPNVYFYGQEDEYFVPSWIYSVPHSRTCSIIAVDTFHSKPF